MQLQCVFNTYYDNIKWSIPVVWMLRRFVKFCQYCIWNIDKSSVYFASETSTDVNYIFPRLIQHCISSYKMIILPQTSENSNKLWQNGTSGKIPGILTFLQRFYKTGIETGISGNVNSQSTWINSSLFVYAEGIYVTQLDLVESVVFSLDQCTTDILL